MTYQIKNLQEMQKIISTTTQPTVSSGPTAQRDFEKYGRIELIFYVHTSRGESARIRIDIAGFSTQHIYYIKPKTAKQIQSNTLFYKHYISVSSKKAYIDEIIISHGGELPKIN